MNCQPAPCQSPDTNIVRTVGKATIAAKAPAVIFPRRGIGKPARSRRRDMASTIGL